MPFIPGGRDTHTHRCVSDEDAHRDSDILTHAYTQAQTHANTQTHTRRDTNRQRHTFAHTATHTHNHTRCRTQLPSVSLCLWMMWSVHDRALGNREGVFRKTQLDPSACEYFRVGGIGVQTQGMVCVPAWGWGVNPPHRWRERELRPRP